YYRATSVVPDLAGGRATPPFLAVGGRSAYTVPGGKPVHVYELARPAFSLGGGVSLTTDAGAWPARGKTAPLAKGPVLARDGADLAGDGLGLGVPLARFSDGWWFPGAGSAFEVASDGTSWVREYDLDQR